MGNWNMHYRKNSVLPADCAMTISNPMRRFQEFMFRMDQARDFQHRRIRRVKTSYHALTPMFSISYRAGENAHIYASYRQGYRTGGLTQLSSDPSQPPLYPYQPEYSNNYELGLKGNYFANRFHANLAVFYNTVTGCTGAHIDFARCDHGDKKCRRSDKQRI